MVNLTNKFARITPPQFIIRNIMCDYAPSCYYATLSNIYPLQNNTMSTNPCPIIYYYRGYFYILIRYCDSVFVIYGDHRAEKGGTDGPSLD